MSDPYQSQFTWNLLHPRHWLTWLGIGLIAPFSLLPRRARHAIGRELGRFIYTRKRKRTSIVETNFQVAFPELDNAARQRLVREHLNWYGCGIMDSLVLLFGSKRRIAKMVVLEGREHVDAAIARDQSVIVLLLHSVMQEFTSAALDGKYDYYGSYKKARDPVLDWLVAYRRGSSAKFGVSREQGLRKLVRELVPKQLLVFLPDEDLGVESSVFAPFFGVPKATLTTPARIAKIGKAVSLPCFAYYDELLKKYIVQISAPIENYPSGDSVQDAIALNQSIEEIIQKAPMQYLWVMKCYRTRPEGMPPLYRRDKKSDIKS